MDTTSREPFSLAYQITQNCIFQCDICHRRVGKQETALTARQRRTMVDILKEQGLKRLTVTGGEPILLGAELFDFLKYAHEREVHTCLSTTGYRLNQEKLEHMDEYLDQLLVPIRSLTRQQWRKDFGATKNCDKLFDTVTNLLQWIKTTGIILEISTVVHKKNINEIGNLGWQLLSLNPNIIWRIDQYYAMGLMSDHSSEFELEDARFEEMCNQVEQTFGTRFKFISFSRKYGTNGRVKAPDFFITPTGNLVNTSNNKYSKSRGNILKRDFPPGFHENRRPWANLKPVCRDWGWGN